MNTYTIRNEENGLADFGLANMFPKILSFLPVSDHYAYYE